MNDHHETFSKRSILPQSPYHRTLVTFSSNTMIPCVLVWNVVWQWVLLVELPVGPEGRNASVHKTVGVTPQVGVTLDASGRDP